MKKLRNLLAATSMIFSLLFISSCNTSNDKKELFVLPTEIGEKYLEKKVIKNHAKKAYSELKFADDIPNEVEGNAYLLNVDSSAISDGANVKFNSNGTSYSSNDIDVLLFGIGTNLNNSPAAETMLYASLDADGGTSTKNLVTGVEYAYGTGPIKNEIGVKQTLWLKTTIMEEAQPGVYINSPDSEVNYTPLYITLEDKSAPTIDGFSYNITYSQYINSLKSSTQTLEENIKSLIYNKYHTYHNNGKIDKEEKPDINEVTVTDKKEEYFANDVIKGTFNAIDSSGNISNNNEFNIYIEKDFNDDTVTKLGYSNIIGTLSRKYGKTVSAEEGKSYIKTEVLKTFTNDGRNLYLGDRDVEVFNIDEVYNSIKNDLKGSLSEDKVFTLNIKINGYKYSAESEVFPVKFKVYDDVPISNLDITLHEDKAENLLESGVDGVDQLSELAAKIPSVIMSINDDYDDGVYYAVIDIYYASDFATYDGIIIYTLLEDEAIFKSGNYPIGIASVHTQGISDLLKEEISSKAPKGKTSSFHYLINDDKTVTFQKQDII